MGKLLSRGMRKARVATGYEVVPAKIFIVDDRITGQDQAAQDLFLQLRIDQTVINCLYSKFLEIDKDGSHEIDIDEYYRHFKMERTPWADKVFMIMDEDGSGEIDFREFVIATWNYCSLDLKNLIKFAFSMFDIDGAGTLEAEDLRELVVEIYGDSWDANVRVQKLVDVIDKNRDGVISFDEFQQINRRYPALLFPAFRMQEFLRRGVYGVTWWKVMSEKRRLDAQGRSTSIYEMLSKINDAAYKDALNVLITEAEDKVAAEKEEEEEEARLKKERRREKK
eukprot:g4581.t1